MNTKLKNIVVGVLFLISTLSFSQERRYTDREIGFDKKKETEFLSKIGVKRADLASQIRYRRAGFLENYIQLNTASRQRERQISKTSFNDPCSSFPEGIDGTFESCEPIAQQSMPPNGEVTCSGWSNYHITPDSWKFPLTVPPGTVYSQNIVPSPNGGGVFAGGASKVGEAFSVDVSNLEVGETYSLKFYQSHGTNFQNSLPNDYTRWKLTFGSETLYGDDILITEFPTWEEQHFIFTASSTNQELIVRAVPGTSTSGSYAHMYSLIDGIELAKVLGNITANGNLCIDQSIPFSFNTPNASEISSYSWIFYNTNGTILYTSIASQPSYTYQNPGLYNVSLTVTLDNGCSYEFSEDFQIIDCENPCNDSGIIVVNDDLCSNESIPFNFNTESTSGVGSYSWTFFTNNGTTLYTSTASQPSYIFQNPGAYSVLLNVTFNNGCSYESSLDFEIEDCNPPCQEEITDIQVNQCPSRTDNSRRGPQVLCMDTEYCYSYTLIGASNSGDASTYSFLWTFYDTDGTTVLETSTNQFAYYAFQNAGAYTVSLSITFANGCVASYSETIVIEDCNPDPCDTVAIIVDESGSLSDDELQDIRTGLSRFIADQLDSGLSISITGMSDSDTDLRNDHIPKQKVTAVTKPIFDQWIANYGNRNGQPGISGSSDYWASALSVINTSDYIPESVVIFTDGSQTADINYLKDQINLIRTNSNLYVYGIDNEYYVNGDNVLSRLSKDQDPNYTSISKSTNSTMITSRAVVSSLRTSLDYLFGLGEPTSGQSNLLDADYYGYADFSGFTGVYGTELGVLSNLLANSGIVCAQTLDECYACYSFQPEPGKMYWISAWVKEDLNIQVKSYTNASLTLYFIDAADQVINTTNIYPTGNIIDGWQRIAGKFEVPATTVTLDIELSNDSDNIPIYFDDVRVHPIQGNMKSFVYDPITFRLLSELDENNYSTYYEYDQEGGLVRIKKETSKGIKTIQETRSGTVIKTN